MTKTETRRQADELAKMIEDFCAFSLSAAQAREGYAGALARFCALKRRGRRLLLSWGYAPTELPSEPASREAR